MSSNRRPLITLFVAGLVLCLCTAAIALPAAAIGLGWFVSREVAGAPTEPPLTDPDAIGAEMERIAAFVIATRGLEPSRPVDRQFLTVPQVRERTIRDFEEDTTPQELADSTRILAALDLVEPDLDLYELLVRLYSEGVAGFYDPDTQELVIVSDAEGLSLNERVTYAHEYNHALQDQAFGIRASGYSDEMWDTDPERALAIQALIEGDASLLEDQYLGTFTAEQRRAYRAEIARLDVSIYDELPPYLLVDFIFPYRQGLDFVRRYYDQGGWAAVDALWAAPPVSAEHILHPERFEAGDAPVPVPMPALTTTLGSGWRLLDEGTNGEWYTYLILAYGLWGGLDEDDAARAAEGWGGDGYTAYGRDDTGGLVLAQHWVWDAPAEAEEFAQALRDYGQARFGNPANAQPSQVCWAAVGLTCFFFDDQATLWLTAPDPSVLETVLAEFPTFGEQ